MGKKKSRWGSWRVNEVAFESLVGIRYVVSAWLFGSRTFERLAAQTPDAPFPFASFLFISRHVALLCYD